MQPFDGDQDVQDAPRVGGAQRPKDAATLILTRGPADDPEVLMGRRAKGHVFMASKWVFPGGRVERADFTTATFSDLRSEDISRLLREVPPRRARALAVAAVRETWEETGLHLARPSLSEPQGRPLPHLGALRYIARAITPPGRSRRFDARFFMANASALLTSEPTTGSGELDEIAWAPLSEARALELPAITRFVMDELAQRLLHMDRPLPFVRMVGGRHVVEYQD